jgi:hypothetical protein
VLGPWRLFLNESRDVGNSNVLSGYCASPLISPSCRWPAFCMFSCIKLIIVQILSQIIIRFFFKELLPVGHQWLMAIILATQEAKIRRIVVWSQFGQIVCETLSQKHPSQKKAGGVAGGGPEFKPQNYQKKKKVLQSEGHCLVKFHNRAFSVLKITWNSWWTIILDNYSKANGVSESMRKPRQ